MRKQQSIVLRAVSKILIAPFFETIMRMSFLPFLELTLIQILYSVTGLPETR